MNGIGIQSQPEISAIWKIAIGLGFFIGMLNVFSPGALFSLLLVLSIILAIRLFAGQDEKRFLMRIFIYGVSIRAFLLFLIQFLLITKGKWVYYALDNRATVLLGDDGYNTVVGWWMANNFLGRPLNNYTAAFQNLSFAEYGQSGYLYLVALFYYVFGYSPISVTFINCILSALTGIIYYSIAKNIMGLRSAKITAILVTFLPSLITWSIINLKEPLFIFLTGVILWLSVQLFKNFKFRYLILLVLSLILQFTFRRWILLPSILIISSSYLLVRKKINAIQILLLLLILFANSAFLKDKFDDFKYEMISYHWGVLSSGGTTYNLYDVEYKPGLSSEQVSYLGFLKGFFKGWFHRFLEPFPWRLYSDLSLASFPQIIIWYFLLPFAAIGILMQLTNNCRKSLILILYFLIIGSILALTGGNIGTDFRTRDVLTPLFLLFSSFGLVKIFGFKNTFIR